HQWQQCPAQFELPREMENPKNSKIAVATETYFPVQDLYRDARRFWMKILSRHVGRKLLIVSHSATIHALLSTALGLPPECHHSLQQSNCGISELEFFGLPSFSQASFGQVSFGQSSFGRPTPGACVQLHQLNQTTILGELLPKLKVNKQGLRLLLVPSGGPGDEIDGHHFQRLAERIKGLPIDFCLSTDEGQPWLGSLMQQHPKMLCLGTQNATFLQDWQQHLSQSHRPDEPLMTGLAIASTASIQKILGQTLSQTSGQMPVRDSAQGEQKHALSHQSLVLRPGHLSVVHYPYGHRPVVQSINS
ncbi:MAG: histidine phosphatase family protein, partial [Cyanobacteria bacterium J06598_3]